MSSLRRLSANPSRTMVRCANRYLDSGHTRGTETRYHLATVPSPTSVRIALDDAGYRLTGARRSIAELIAGRSGPFTAADLAADARRRRRSVGRATIFRTLDVLTELRLVERIDLPSGEHAYLACEPAHHHHVVCSSCGRSRDVDDAGWRSVVQDIEARTGYRIDDHRLELFGRCPGCQSEDASPGRIDRRDDP
jgi:Fur family transcriptional regulator, ferric uptake regulator